MSTRQKHIAVPSSNSPPIPEWSAPYWYVLRTAALQAKADLSDVDVALLITSFEAYKVTLPCPKCRTHYIADWQTFPFTTTEAKSPQLAMKWVEDLRIRIEARRKIELAAEAAEKAAKTGTVSVSAARASRPARATPPPPPPKPAARAAPRAAPIRSDAISRQIAIQSAVQQTVKRPGGCNCGKRR